MSGFTEHIEDVRLSFDRGRWAKIHKILALTFVWYQIWYQESFLGCFSKAVSVKYTGDID